MRKAGVTLLVLGWLLLLYTALGAPAYARAHAHMLDARMIGAYADPWPVALTSTIAFFGVVLAMGPVRRGERWASLTTLVAIAVLFATRIASDPRCLVVLDVHQHGCHSFMIAMVMCLIGVALAWRRA